MQAHLSARELNILVGCMESEQDEEPARPGHLLVFSYRDCLFLNSHTCHFIFILGYFDTSLESCVRLGRRCGMRAHLSAREVMNPMFLPRV